MPSTGAERQRRYMEKLRARAERADRLERACRDLVAIPEPTPGELIGDIIERYTIGVRRILQALGDQQ